MRVLLIGGTVFIGRAIASELTAAGHELCLVHRGDHEPDGLPEARHIHVPRLELASAADEIRSFAPEAVVDNIAITAGQVQVVLDVLDPDLRYVVTSSVDVYEAYAALLAGESREPVPLDESSPVRVQRYPFRGKGGVMDTYEKLDVEELYLQRQATVLRLPMVYGPNDYQRREEPVLRRVRAGRKRIPAGTGTWLSTRGYVADIARGVRLALTSDAAPGQIFNLCETCTYPEGVWARMILKAAGSDAELVRVSDDALPPDLGSLGTVGQHLLASNAKARLVLGYTDTDHADALAESVAWHLANPPPEADDDFSPDDTALEQALG